VFAAVAVSVIEDPGRQREARETKRMASTVGTPMGFALRLIGVWPDSPCRFLQCVLRWRFCCFFNSRSSIPIPRSPGFLVCACRKPAAPQVDLLAKRRIRFIHDIINCRMRTER